MGLYAIFNSGEVAAAGVVFPVVGTVLVVMRTIVRRKKVNKLEIDDWLVFPALALTIGMGIATIVGVAKKAEGYEIGGARGYKRALVAQVYWYTEWMQPLALGFIKLSFMFFYRRIFNVGTKNAIFSIVSLVSIFIMLVWMLGFWLAVLLICPGHPTAYWTSAKSKAEYCWDTTKFLYALCWSDVGTDLIVLVLPIPSVLRLHMTPKKKIAVIGIFSLGALTLAASITRAVFYVQLLTAEKTVVATYDPVMLNTNGIYWMLVETGLALIAVNLPLLYGSVKHEGIGTIVRKVRSMASLRSQSSTYAKDSNAISRRDGDESSEGGRDVELVYGVHKASDSKAMREEPSQPRQLEEGRINVTNTYSVDQR